MAEEKRPVTMTIKVQHDGYGADITAELYVDQIPGLIKKLRASDILPANSPYVWEPQQAGDAGGEVVAPLCPVHGTRMKQSTKGSGWYCPRKVEDGGYCRAKVSA